MRRQLIPLTDHQTDFVFCDEPFPAFVGGYGSGKTEALVVRLIMSKISYSNLDVGYFAPTFDLLRLIAWPRFEAKLDAWGIPYKLNRSDYTMQVAGSGKIIFRSMEVPDRIVGFEIADAAVDELDTLKEDDARYVWDRIVARCRQRKPDGAKNSAAVATTPEGRKFVYRRWEEETKPGYHLIRASTRNNPYLPDGYIDQLKGTFHPDLLAAYLDGQFVDLSGTKLFGVDKWLIDGKPVTYPHICDGVYAVIDTAVKGGGNHDATAVGYFALSNYVGTPLVILDWDMVHIDGALLEDWLPTVFQRLEELARQCRARSGMLGAWIEDAAAGSVLIQQAARRGWPARAIETKLTSVGKDSRAISVSGYHHREMVKISEYAYDKVITFKDASRNHFLSQVTEFYVGDKNSGTRADDLLDVYVYGVAIGLGNKEGY